MTSRALLAVILGGEIVLRLLGGEVLAGPEDCIVRAAGKIGGRALLRSGPAGLDPTELRFTLRLASNAEEVVDGIASLELTYQGKSVGMSTVRRTTLGDKWAFQNIVIKQELSGNRLGTLSYLILGKNLFEKTGIVLRSDPFSISEAALKTWESLERQGFATRLSPRSFELKTSKEALQRVDALVGDLNVNTEVAPVYNAGASEPPEPW